MTVLSSIFDWDYTKQAKIVAPEFLNYRLALAVVCVMIVIALVLFAEEMLPALRVMGPWAHGTRRDGEDDCYDDKCCYDGDGNDLSQSDGTGWRENCEHMLWWTWSMG